jgi:outer membrane protein OmpA-like peptidoglycan-associated protein/tetratricopeptide (TPR) repeat protein
MKEIMKPGALALICAALLFSCSAEKKILRKASNAVDRMEFDQALNEYDKLIQKDANSFYGNAGKGIVLSEFMARHEQAIPYLEKALTNSPPKSKPIIHGDLARSYHFIGNYKRALLYYDKISAQNDPKYSDYDEFLTKRIADCRYALEHPKVALPENQSLTNVGKPVNTDMPEYAPVFTNGQLFFTTKRKDDPKEKKNAEDGKYYESVYVTKMQDNGTFETPKRYTIPEPGFHFRKYGEAVLSASQDGKTLYIYKGGKIYESDANDPAHKITALDKNINFAMMNHACLTPDGKSIYFSAEDEKTGHGGSDIYVSTKDADGKWGDPKLLPYNINSSYDEDAPYINEQGVLFFSSNGLPGYGGFDVYRTKQVNGVWIAPENMGQPINSPGDDMNFTLAGNTSKGYYASARPGGMGDLDIYKVHYTTMDVAECVNDSMLVIQAEPSGNNPLQFNISVKVPDNYKNDVRSYRWAIDNKELAETGDKFTHTFEKNANYQVSSRVTVYCEDCPNLQAKCNQISVTAGKTLITASENEQNGKENMNPGSNDKSKAGALKKGKTNENTFASAKNKKGNKTNPAYAAAYKTDRSSGSSESAMNAGNANDNPSGNSGPNANASNNSSGAGGLLDDSRLSALNWNTGAMKFGYNQSDLDASTREYLQHNANVLKSNPKLMVEINGYADSRGESEYNRSLSARRADCVKQFLTNAGVSPKQIKSAKGQGESQLVNECSDGVDCPEEKHAQNRRVTILVSESKGSSNVTSN